MTDPDIDDLAELFRKPIPEENKTKLNTEDWERFCAALDTPLVPNCKLRELLARDECTTEIARLRAWIEAIGSLSDVDADERAWMSEHALAGKPAPQSNK